MPNPKPVKQIRTSQPYNFLYGCFALREHSIPYMVVSMGLKDAARDLEIAEELDLEIKGTKLRDLYQRQLNWARVLDEIVPYLQDPKRPQFFNALTVTVVPYRKGRFVDFAENDFVAPDLEGDYEANEAIGPVRIGLYGGSFEDPDSIQVGKVIWNTDEVKCVTIDGQHRLAALKHLHENDDQGLYASKITVILIMPAARFGLKGEDTNKDNILLMRKMFTDLNKHAVTVSRSRELLLDDYDPQSVCVRRVIVEEVVDVGQDWKVKDPTRLPLPLIDWHTDDAKFDSGPYVSSLLVLDQSVGKLMGINPIRDWTEEKAVSGQVNALRELGWLPSQECENRLSQSSSNGTPFSYPKEDLEEIGDCFTATWAASIVHLLTVPYAYAGLLSDRQSNQMVSSEFVAWYEVFERYMRSKNVRSYKKLLRVQDSLKREGFDYAHWKGFFDRNSDDNKDYFTRAKSSSLFYRVVFQKALFNSLKFLSGVERSDKEDLDQILSSPQDVKIHEISSARGVKNYLWAKDLSDVINALSKNGDFFVAKHRIESESKNLFWLGSVVRADDPEVIDFTNAAAKRASDWLSVAALLWHVSTFEDVLFDMKLTMEYASWEKFLKELKGFSSTALDALGNQISGDKAGRTMRRIVGALRPDLTSDDQEFGDLLKENLMCRLIHLWSQIKEARET